MKVGPDPPPEKSKEFMDWMEINDGYFAVIADDLTDEQAQASSNELQTLCDSILKSF